MIFLFLSIDPFCTFIYFHSDSLLRTLTARLGFFWLIHTLAAWVAASEAARLVPFSSLRAHLWFLQRRIFVMAATEPALPGECDNLGAFLMAPRKHIETARTALS